MQKNVKKNNEEKSFSKTSINWYPRAHVKGKKTNN